MQSRIHMSTEFRFAMPSFVGSSYSFAIRGQLSIWGSPDLTCRLFLLLVAESGIRIPALLLKAPIFFWHELRQKAELTFGHTRDLYGFA